MASDIVICAPVRTAIGTFGGTLKDTPAPQLGAIAIKAAVECAGIAGGRVDGVIMAQVIQVGVGMNGARQATIGAGLPVGVPALTLNRVCGSGLQAVVSAAESIVAGNAQAIAAGGMENMDRAPYLAPSGRWGARMGDAKLIDSMLHDGLNDAFSGQHSGWHTEELVTRFAISRDDQDRWALRSQQRFAAAQVAGHFDGEIVPIDITVKGKVTTFAHDEHNRPETTIETLAKLKPAFRKDGTITAGNSPGLNSGAAAMIVGSRDFAAANRLEPWARIVSYGVVAVEPGMFGIAPVAAVRKTLDRAGWTIGDLDRVEINEAFAAVAL